MPAPLRHLAPAGAPISIADLARWATTTWSPGASSEQLGGLLQERFGMRNVVLTSTGRAGMTVLLRAMRRLSPTRDEVVLPAYTCYSVAASVLKAGLRPRILDISPRTLDYAAPDATDYSRVLAIVATNLYGLPNDLPALSALAKRHGVFLVDDAAQSMGATIGGRDSGTWGDVGVFSFDKGKNVSAIDGGALLTNSDTLAEAIRDEMAGCQTPPLSTSIAHVVKAVAYSMLLRPWLYGLPARIPQLGLGRTPFTTDFPLAQADPALVRLGGGQIRHLDAFTETRVANARILIDELRSLGQVRTVRPLAGSTPVYLRLPILFDSRRGRDAALDALTKAGLGASGSYPGSIREIAEVQQVLANPLEEADGGRHVAERILTLPTHPFVTRRDIARMVSVMADVGSRHAVDSRMVEQA